MYMNFEGKDLEENNDRGRWFIVIKPSEHSILRFLGVVSMFVTNVSEGENKMVER